MLNIHFNVPGEPDREGSFFDDVEAARRQAIQLAADHLFYQAETLLPREWWLEATDDAGTVLFRLAFSMSEPSPLP